MADLYRVVYITKSQDFGKANVSATSPANAVAAAKSNDSMFLQHCHVTVMTHNVITGS